MSEVEALRAELESLRAEVRALSVAPPVRADEPVSRRALLGRLAGVAAAGAGMAVVGGRPAAATAGNPVVLGASGTTNDSGTQGTYVKATTSVQHAFDVTQQGAGIALGVDTTDTSTDQPALWVRHNGHGPAIDAATFDEFGTPAIIGTAGTGVRGVALNNGNGVLGESDGGIGVYGYTDTGRAVYGYAGSGAGTALYGYSNGDYAAQLHCPGGVQMHLHPGATAGKPTAGGWQVGDVYVDSKGVHWHCLVAGTPGTWARPGYNPVTPVRVVSSTTATGTYSAGQTKDIQIAGSHGVPTAATAVAVNVNATSTANGSLKLFKDGTSLPPITQLYYGSSWKWSGFAIVPLSTAGKISCYCSQGTTKVSIDVSGFFV